MSPDKVIAGWVDALKMMHTGAKWQLYIPSTLAYGDQAVGTDIGAGRGADFRRGVACPSRSRTSRRAGGAPKLTGRDGSPSGPKFLLGIGYVRVDASFEKKMGTARRAVPTCCQNDRPLRDLFRRKISAPPPLFRLPAPASILHCWGVISRVLKVAVVIPLHNHARFIGAALESLRVQSRPPDRVIILDDGSTDGSVNAVVAYAESVPVKTGERRSGPDGQHPDPYGRSHASARGRAGHRQPRRRAGRGL